MADEFISLDALVKEFSVLWKSGADPELAQFLERVPEAKQAEAARLLIAVMVGDRQSHEPWRSEQAESRKHSEHSEHSEGEQRLHSKSPRVGSDSQSFEGTADPSDASRAETQVIGPYTLLRKLGEGGMGEVWMAEQEKPVRRRVALKLIKKGLDNQQVIARFEVEKQALALMDHQNIAKVFDAGTTPDGHPYFVMELVQGVPLTKYCDDNKLSIEQRLKLFIDVCAGVQHAHQKGIIHRDLKPGNILVALQDGQPIPKVIDFGLAKATESTQRLTDQSLFTGIGQILGTLKYMSPEQASLDNLDIDTRTDIYALGVILYELLTGSTPLDDSTIKGQAALKLLELIREKEPVKPSSRLGNSTNDEASSITNRRQTDSGRLSRILAGDLDWIVMKALEKDRTRRYESASGFAADVHRYLNSEPVNARPPSVSYRFQKFVRKHRVGVLAATLVALALIGGIAGTGLALVRALRAEQAAETRRQEAETNLAFARKGNEILGSVFAALDPNAVYNEVSDLRNALRDNLNRAVDELQGSAIGDPLEVEAMQTTLGKSLVGLGEYSTAIEVFQRSSEILKQRLGHDHPRTLGNLNHLALSLEKSGQWEQALPIFEQVYELRKSKLELDHPETLSSMSNLAACYQTGGQLDKALPLYQQASDLAQAKLGREHVETLTKLNNLATAYLSLRQFDQALPLFEQTLPLLQAKRGPNHPETLISMSNLGAAYMATGQLDRAIPLLEQALELKKTKLGLDHPETIVSMNNLATGYFNSRQWEKSRPWFERALELRKNKLGLGHPLTLASFDNLLANYASAGLLDRYLELLETADAQWRKSYPAKSPQLAFKFVTAGLSLQQLKQYPEAERFLRDCLNIRKEIDSNLWSTFNTQSILGGALLEQLKSLEDETINSTEINEPLKAKQLTEIEFLLVEGYRGMKQCEPSIPPTAATRIPEALDRLVEFYLFLGKADEAQKYRELRAAYPPASQT